MKKKALLILGIALFAGANAFFALQANNSEFLTSNLGTEVLAEEPGRVNCWSVFDPADDSSVLRCITCDYYDDHTNKYEDNDGKCKNPVPE
ncbi:MAG: hypothetical protein U9N86_01380 [Bacteroidota bacterium]|nr:hypothetical protein [Bacteroidota bacterium]